MKKVLFVEIITSFLAFIIFAALILSICVVIGFTVDWCFFSGRTSQTMHYIAGSE